MQMQVLQMLHRASSREAMRLTFTNEAKRARASIVEQENALNLIAKITFYIYIESHRGAGSLASCRNDEKGP